MIVCTGLRLLAVPCFALCPEIVFFTCFDATRLKAHCRGFLLASFDVEMKNKALALN